MEGDNIMKLYELLNIMKEEQIAKVTFGAIELWYVTKRNHVVRYCDENGDTLGDIVLLTRSNLEADYEIING